MAEFIDDQNDNLKLVALKHPNRNYELVVFAKNVPFYQVDGFQVKDEAAEAPVQKLLKKEGVELSDLSKIFEANIDGARFLVSKLLNPILNFVRKKGE